MTNKTFSDMYDWRKKEGLALADNNARASALFSYLYSRRENICKKIVVPIQGLSVGYDNKLVWMDILPNTRPDGAHLLLCDREQETLYLYTQEIAVKLNPIVERPQNSYFSDTEIIRGISMGLYQLNIRSNSVLAGSDYARFCGEARFCTPSSQGESEFNYYLLYKPELEKLLQELINHLGLEAKLTNNGIPDQDEFCRNNDVVGCGEGSYRIKEEI